MRHILLTFISIIFFLTPPSQIRAQGIDGFIENYKSVYERHLKKAHLDTSLTYIPTIMNLSEKKNNSWYDLSIPERQCKFLSYIYHPILANDFAFDVSNGRYFYFPEGWLFHNLPRHRVNRMTTPQLFPLSEKVLLEYLQKNHADYVFTVVNVGDGSIDCRYWTISDKFLYILRYNEELNELYAVEAMDLIKENLSLFK